MEGEDEEGGAEAREGSVGRTGDKELVEGQECVCVCV